MAVSAVLAPAVTQTSTLEKPPSHGDSSLSSSPRQYPTELSDPILEEGDESESENPNEPVTPVSGRQSQDFHNIQNHEIPIAADNSAAAAAAAAAFNSIRHDNATTPKPPLILNTAATPPPSTPDAASNQQFSPPATAGGQEPAPSPLQRRSTRGSTTSFKRTMSSIFKRSNSASNNQQPFGLTDAASETTLAENDHRKPPTRRWSMNRSSATTRSNTPPSPGSPILEMAPPHKQPELSMPSSDDFIKKKNRASTGLSLRSRAVNFVSSKNGLQKEQKERPGDRLARRRASSFDYSKTNMHIHYDPENPTAPHGHQRQILYMAADAGVGVKARRLSLSLPDDYAVDIAELQHEYEYQHKFIPRHRKHLGKGATSKVQLMSRKGNPEELYAVKEFRGKSSSETQDEYDKKVKSEYSIAKSLHHPNIVETIRLCTDHGRWNHVMEYCGEGDLFSLVQQGYLKKEDRQMDRLCLFKQLIQGLNYLHSNGIAHRDIKLENLLITKESKLKITDFGVSEVFSGIHPGLREAGGQCGVNMGEIRLCSPGICGSEPYIAPEVLSKEAPYDPRALDVWSAAVVMINLIFGAPIWERAVIDAKTSKPYLDLVKGWNKWNNKHPDPEEQVITESDYPYFEAFDVFVSPPALRRVLLQMLNPDPKRRVGINDVINNRWVKNIECCQLESYDDPALSIDASKKCSIKLNGTKKIFCHSHVPLKSHGHTLGRMPGQAGY